MRSNIKKQFNCSRCKAEMYIPLDQCDGLDECMICGYPLRRYLTKRQVREAVEKNGVIVRRIIRRRIPDGIEQK